MKKRLTALFLALCLVMSVAVLPVSAADLSKTSDYLLEGGKEALGIYADYYGQIGAYWVYLNSYLEGNMSYDAFKSKTDALMYDIDDEADRNVIQQLVHGIGQSLEGINYAGSNATAGVIQGLRECIEGLGDGFSGLLDFFDSVWNKFSNENGYTTSDIDMQGYGAVCYHYEGDNLYKIVYSDYGIIYPSISYQIVAYNNDGSNIICYYVNSDNYIYTNGVVGYLNDNTNNHYVFYGDWRYEDDTPADDLITDNGESSLSPDDLPEDTDLTDFLKDLLEKLMNAFPDTSTIEGLLRAILAKLDTLDSDNDNELLSQILVAIQALEDNGLNVDNSELVKALNDLKKALVIGDGAEAVTLGYLLKKLVDNQIKLSDITIDDSLYNIRFKFIQAKLLGKFNFFTEINDFINYAVDCYKNTSENPTIELTFDNLSIMRNQTIDFSFFNDYIDTIRFIVAAFVYLTFAFKTFRKIPGYINGGDNT